MIESATPITEVAGKPQFEFDNCKDQRLATRGIAFELKR